ncbi:MAG: TetR/AcrR family transcriptional regulator [Bacilli bacterium]|nr:TetR/AcrR family transcriptional regulator [Bacilli bacterium]
MGKVDIRIIRTKKAIESAFIEILSEKSFTKITIEEICRKANVNRMSFYNHYEDKYDLLNVIITNVKETLIGKFLAEVGTEFTEEKVISVLMETTEKLVDLGTKYKNSIYMLINDEDNSLAQYIIYKSLESSTLDLLYKLKDTYNLDSHLLPLMASYLTGGGTSMILSWIRNKGNYTKDDLTSLMKDFIESAILILHKIRDKA